MTSANGSRPHRAVPRTGVAPETPWRDFDDLMDRMVGLFGVDRPVGQGEGLDADGEPRPDV
ncbi:hypothetical protein [Streptomyces sp. NPDC002467]|uniref:hypothetical protein n=1 Tax=Streptomyces sp. NPDC002467 TaxID=3364647 RepID=UPI0036A853C2